MNKSTNFIDLTGQSFGNWLVLNRTESVTGHTCWLCQCKCGTIKSIQGQSLKNGDSQSCGCLFPANNTKHGLKNHPLYKIWKGMKQRCLNPNNKRYKNYMGRGVSICDEWLNDPLTFVNWAIANGWKPGMQIDKDIIPKKNGIPALLYSPKTCCIVTPLENYRNSSKCKLTKEKADLIRKSNLSNRELANMYGVHTDTIGLVKRNKIWV